jgi:hypothetical protein
MPEVSGKEKETQSMELVSGFIVEGPGFHFLDKTRTAFRTHSENETPFVHPLEGLLAGGDWMAQATRVFPGVYNPDTTLSETTGAGVAFTAFIASQYSVAAQAGS